MKVGMFHTPYTRPDRTGKETFDWAVKQAVHADKVGFSEFFVGEHATIAWEGIPSPELIIAAAAAQTTQITLGPLAHLLPFHHPATLAIQTAWLSQILEGRYILGIASGVSPTDAALRGITDMAVTHDMMWDAFRLMKKVWECKPFQEQSRYWNVGYPELDPFRQRRDIGPWGGEMKIMMTGLSAPSPSIAYAGEHGFAPASIYAGNGILRSHFETYAEKMEQSGRKADRSMHRVCREVIVAETDAEARKIALTGGHARAWEEYIKPAYLRRNILKNLLPDPKKNPEEVDTEYLAEHVWIVGSVETVRQKMDSWFSDLDGGFGTLLIPGHDYIDNPEPWEHSMDLLANQVAPQLTTKKA